MLMTAADYRESLRRYRPRVYLRGEAVASVADAPAFLPGINAIGLTYDYALSPELRRLMIARQHTSGRDVNRMIHLDNNVQDLLYKLEAVRVVCRETGCAQRYLGHDSLAALFQTTFVMDAETGGELAPFSTGHLGITMEA